MRKVATYLIGVAIGLVLLGIWQQARRQAQQSQPTPAGVEQAPVTSSGEAAGEAAPGPEGAP